MCAFRYKLIAGKINPRKYMCIIGIDQGLFSICRKLVNTFDIILSELFKVYKSHCDARGDILIVSFYT